MNSPDNTAITPQTARRWSVLRCFFPRYLGRFAYLILLIPLEVVVLWTLSILEDPYAAESGQAWPIIVFAVATLYLVFVVMLARVRDIGWHPASILIGLIPIIGGAFGLALLLKRGTGHEVETGAGVVVERRADSDEAPETRDV